MTVTMQSPYSLPQYQQPQYQQFPQYQTQQFPPPAMPIAFEPQHQFQSPFGAPQQYQVYPGYQAVLVQIPQHLIPELFGQQRYGQAGPPVLPIAYAPGAQAGGLPIQQLPVLAQPQSPYGQPQFAQQFAQPQFIARPTLW